MEDVAEPQPPRAQVNLASVYGAALARGTATRAELIADTGLSKATVARMVDELHRGGLLETADPSPPVAPGAAARGRKPTSLTVPPTVGQVVGISLGLQRTGVLALDVAGRERSWDTAPTPGWRSTAEAVRWVADRVAAACARTEAPLLRIGVGVPARVVHGAEIPKPPPSMSVLAGTAFREALASTLAAPVVLDGDANMALIGLVADGAVADSANPTLLNMSTVLTIAVRRMDGSAAPGLSSSFGDFSLLPFHSAAGDSTLGAMLSTQGLLDWCAQRGTALTDITDLWGGRPWDASPSAAGRPQRSVAVVRRGPGGDGRTRAPREHAEVRELFAEALASALRIIAVLVDPPLVVLTGRLAPLAELVLPEVRRALGSELDEPPELVVASAESRWHATSLGAAHVVLRHEQRALCSRLAAGSPG